MTVRPATADRIAETALRLHTVHGYAGTSMEQVRREAGVSNGSLYHHFASRAELAARLLMDGMAGLQQVVLQALEATSDAEQGVQEVVRGCLCWVEGHSELARLVYGDLPDEVLQAAEPALGERNRRYVDVVGGWLAGHAERGTIASRPFGVTHALWLGPAQDFARQWLSGRSKLTPCAAAADLSEGAWRALRVG